MGRKVCLLLALLHCAMTESTIIYPTHCLNATVAPNRMKCFSWTYNETSSECNLIPAGIINLFEDTNFIYPPGYRTGGYANNYFCIWRISPKSSCHKTGFFLLHKDLHAINPSSGTDCPVKDHIHWVHSEDQSDYFCGDNSTDNCDVYNCPPPGFTESSGETYVTFRSDAAGTASGFLAMTVGDIEIDGCKKRRAVDLMSVPQSYKCSLYKSYLSSKFRYQIPCECSGNCTVSREESRNTRYLRRVINGILANPREVKLNAYKYVNSSSNILRSVARRVLENIEMYGIALPTIGQQFKYASERLDQCTELESVIKSNPETCPAAYNYLQRRTG